MTKKIPLNQELRISMKEYLADKTLKAEFQKLVDDVINFSERVYQRVTPENFEQKIETIGLNSNWFNYSAKVTAKVNSNALTVRASNLSFSNFEDWASRRLAGSQVPLDTTQLHFNSVNLYFNSPRFVPLRLGDEVFALTDAEIAEYKKLVTKHHKNIIKTLEAVRTAYVLINTTRNFEDLFHVWDKSEKLFARIYQERKAELTDGGKKNLPSVNFQSLNSDLKL